eukprot:g1494.t1
MATCIPEPKFTYVPVLIGSWDGLQVMATNTNNWMKNLRSDATLSIVGITDDKEEAPHSTYQNQQNKFIKDINAAGAAKGVAQISTTVPNGFVLPGKLYSRKEGRKLDIVLVLDNSRSIDDADKLKVRDFARGLMSPFVISDQYTKFGVVWFATDAHLRAGLTGDATAIATAIDLEDETRATDIVPFTDIDAGMRKAKQELDANGRAGVPKLVVLVTDGIGSDPTTVVSQLKGAGVHITTVGFGTGISSGARHALTTWASYRGNGRMLHGLLDATNSTTVKDYHEASSADKLADILVFDFDGHEPRPSCSAGRYCRDASCPQCLSCPAGTSSLDHRIISYAELTGTANPFDGIELDDWNSVFTFGDVDGDSDLDLLVGAEDGVFSYYRNDGSTTTPKYTKVMGAGNPFNGIGGDYNNSAPTLADVDGDGDLDLVVGEYFGTLKYYRNDGSNATSPHYVELLGAKNPFAGRGWASSAGLDSKPTFGDMDGDGDLDLVIGTSGGVLYFKNEAFKSDQSPNSSSYPMIKDYITAASPFYVRIDPRAYGKNGEGSTTYIYGDTKFYEIRGDSKSKPVLGDVDGDGDLDLVVVGMKDGTINYYRNDAARGATSPKYVQLTGAHNPFDGIDEGNYLSPTLVDLDDDGDLDLVVRDCGFCVLLPGLPHVPALKYYRNDFPKLSANAAQSSALDVPKN